MTTGKLLVLPGDGIGPEIAGASLAVLERANAAFRLGLEWELMDIGFKALESHGSTLPGPVLEAVRQAPGVILGPVSHLDYPPREQGGINPSAELRVGLDLFANIRPAKSRMGLGLTGEPVDLVIFRECTEGFYADRNMAAGVGEFMPTPDVALSVRKVTARQSRRIARVAFEWAARRRRKVTAVHKANVLRLTDGLFLREVRAVARDFPEVQLEELLIDAAAAGLVRDPARFDCIVTGNMFGDILSDEASAISGGLGLGGSIMAGDERCVAQAQHGSAPDIAGEDKANPTALILSLVMLLQWLGGRQGRRDLVQAAEAIEAAIDRSLQDATTRTPDLGGALGTAAFARHVAAQVG